MAIQSQPSRIPEPFAGSGTKNTIPATNATPSASQAASWASGFPPECSQPISAGGCPVPRNDVNGALNQLSQDFAFRQDGGIWEWSALADYDASRVVCGSDGKIYCSVQQSGPSVVAGAQDPTTDNGTYWTAMPLNDANVVHKTGNEVISGTKTFENHLQVKEEQPHVETFYGFNIEGNPPAEGAFSQFISYTKDGIAIGRMRHQLSTSGNSLMELIARQNIANNAQDAHIEVTVQPDGTKMLRPYGDGDHYLGTAYRRWKQLYASTSTIGTSDERLKNSITNIPDDVLDAWGTVDFVQFQFKDAIAEKGEASARLHSGLIAQRIDAAFKAAGLDVSRYGLFCWDSWEAESDGDSARPAGDRYSLRYEEALCMEAAYQRRRADRAEARLAALEEKLAAIEAKLNS